MDKTDLTQQIREIVEKAEQTDPASEELAQCLNAIIKERKLKGTEVLTVLARITAGYIQRMKREYHTPEQRDKVEDYFDTALQTYITCSDINDMYRRLAEMQRENTN